MATEFHNPISRAVRPEDTVEVLERYRNSQRRGTAEYAAMVESFYDLITDFYEYGWGRSFHFAPAQGGASFAKAVADHQHYLGEALGLEPGMRVLDVGCGVGGPQRALAQRFGATIIGLNISEYQLGKCAAYNRQAGLAELCDMLHGDFMAIPAADSSFDAAYQIEALPHAPDKTSAYAEIFRVLRPGAVFVGYDWCMTAVYDSGNPVHRKLKQGIEYGNALPAIASFDEVANALRAAGFEGIETHDRALDADPETPWYRPLAGRALTLRGPIGRRLTSTALRVLESVGAVPRGSCAVCQFLNVAADSLATAGHLGIFTPMYFHKARKPA